MDEATEKLIAVTLFLKELCEEQKKHILILKSANVDLTAELKFQIEQNRK